MSLDQFSIALTFGSSALFLGLVCVVFAMGLSLGVRRDVVRLGYASFLWAIAGVSVISIVGSLIYQFVYLAPVCELCWVQRIFFYPIVVVIFVALWYRTKETHITIVILALFGLLISIYHYYYQFQKLVLGNALAMPCSSGGILPACSDSPILIFGFVTIPFMGILMFGSFLLLAGLAEYVQRKEIKDVNN
jgi:disulfide bond formation protein DsbB